MIAWTSAVARLGQARIRRSTFQDFSWALARSPGPRCRAWAVLTCFWLCESRRAGWTGSSARPARRSRSSSVNGWCPGWARTACPPGGAGQLREFRAENESRAVTRHESSLTTHLDGVTL